MSLALSENTINEINNAVNEIKKFYRFITYQAIDSDCIFHINGKCKLSSSFQLKNCSGYYDCEYLRITRDD